jgi:hypothetical protein
MELAISVFGFASLLELLLYIPTLWPARKPLAISSLVLTAAATGAIVQQRPCLASIFLLIVSLYRIFNMLRIIEARMQEQFLHRSTFRSSLSLLLYQTIIGGFWWFAAVTKLSDGDWWRIIAVVELLTSIVLLISSRRQLRATIPLLSTESYNARDLPTVTVCVPARNETTSMEECLRSLVASDYPKLEILVLDDCSQDHTSDIIRNFAHEGVRFIKGNEAPTHWLAKNWAYKRLYEEANSELLLFCGVDIRFTPESLRALVVTMLSSRKRMVSLMPQNVTPKTLSYRPSLLIQPMRYAWELCIPRKLSRRPPVLSSCWIVERSLLERAGGFEAVSNQVVPESHFARVAAETSSYSFLRATKKLDVQSLKGLRDQWDTAVRTRYPQVHRKPELVLLVSLSQLFCLVLPFIIFIASLMTLHWQVLMLSGLSVAILVWIYWQVIRLTYGHFLLRGLALLPGTVLFDIYLRHYSMWSYEFHDVIWKGRNVCMPVMHVVPHLPDID